MSALTTLASLHPLSLKGEIGTNPAGFGTLVQWYSRALLLQNQQVMLDLADLHRFEANQCAMLSAMMFDLKERRNITFSIENETVRERFSVLLYNGFLDGEFSKWSDNSITSIQSQAFGLTDTSGFLNYVTRCFQQLPGSGACTGEHNDIASHLLELFTNVRRHAETCKPLFACGEYLPDQHQFRFSLVDLGRGYLGPIQDFTSGSPYKRIGSPVVLAENALRWALTAQNSSLSSTRSGLGLKVLRDYCIGRGGELHLNSDGCYLSGRLGPDGQPVYSAVTVPPFQGSAVHAIFNCE